MVMNSRDSLPALNEMTTVQVMGPYSVSGADGSAWYSGGGNVKAGKACGGNNSPPRPLGSFSFLSKMEGTPERSDERKKQGEA